jgi:hypothetical protein
MIAGHRLLFIIAEKARARVSYLVGGIGGGETLSVLGDANIRLSGNGERQKDWSILPSPTVLPTVEVLTVV